VRNFVEKTRNGYIRHVRMFTAFLGSLPTRLGAGLFDDRPPFLNLELVKRSKRASAVACSHGRALRQKQPNLDQSRGQE
jgi:hypothetical protein